MAEPLSFCMVTTFYPPYHFGGDAMYAYRLTNALARRGHRVTVVHSQDAYRALGGGDPGGSFPHEPGVTVRPLRTAWPLGAATPRTSRAGPRSTEGNSATCSDAAASTSSTSTTSRSPAGRECCATAAA